MLSDAVSFQDIQDLAEELWMQERDKGFTAYSKKIDEEQKKIVRELYFERKKEVVANVRRGTSSNSVVYHVCAVNDSGTVLFNIYKLICRITDGSEYHKILERKLVKEEFSEAWCTIHKYASQANFSRSDVKQPKIRSKKREYRHMYCYHNDLDATIKKIREDLCL